MAAALLATLLLGLTASSTVGCGGSLEGLKGFRFELPATPPELKLPARPDIAVEVLPDGRLVVTSAHLAAISNYAIELEGLFLKSRERWGGHVSALVALVNAINRFLNAEEPAAEPPVTEPGARLETPESAGR